jgi:hypothetical protein
VVATGAALITAGRDAGVETTIVRVRSAARAIGSGRKTPDKTRVTALTLLINASIALARFNQPAEISLNVW